MKPHYPILDGLRGIAAIAVVIYHLMEACYPQPVNHPLHHGYLAVDFFYLLSGFVIGYAYDDRWTSMTKTTFFKIRLVRLHPLVIAGVLLGAIFFIINPFADRMAETRLFKLLATVLIGFTLLPSPDLRGGGETHSLDGTCWSLFYEYFANILYALFGRKINILTLCCLVFLTGIALIFTARWNGDLAAGWDYPRLWMGVVRVMYPFFAGLLLFRVGKFVKIPIPYTISSLMLLLIFLMPTTRHNGLYEAGCIIIVFPVIVAIGAGGQIVGLGVRVCKFCGAISYPLYIIHYPFIYMYTDWIHIKQPVHTQIILVAVILFLFFIVLAWIMLKLYDEPIRAWLKKRYL